MEQPTLISDFSAVVESKCVVYSLNLYLGFGECQNYWGVGYTVQLYRDLAAVQMYSSASITGPSTVCVPHNLTGGSCFVQPL